MQVNIESYIMKKILVIIESYRNAAQAKYTFTALNFRYKNYRLSQSLSTVKIGGGGSLSMILLLLLD